MSGLQAVILCGGLATRMRPATSDIPKSLLSVAGRPFIEWQIERLLSCGFDDFVFCTGHLGAQIESYVRGPGRRFSSDGPAPLGTAGALRKAAPMLAPEFTVFYGDSLLDFDCAAPQRELLAHPECDGVLAVCEWAEPNVVIAGIDSNVVTAVHRSAIGHLDYGACALRSRAIDLIADGQAQSANAFYDFLALRGKLRAYVTSEPFWEIGSPAGRAALDRHLRVTA